MSKDSSDRSNAEAPAAARDVLEERDLRVIGGILTSRWIAMTATAKQAILHSTVAFDVKQDALTHQMSIMAFGRVAGKFGYMAPHIEVKLLKAMYASGLMPVGATNLGRDCANQLSALDPTTAVSIRFQCKSPANVDGNWHVVGDADNAATFFTAADLWFESRRPEFRAHLQVAMLERMGKRLKFLQDHEIVDFYAANEARARQLGGLPILNRQSTGMQATFAAIPVAVNAALDPTATLITGRAKDKGNQASLAFDVDRPVVHPDKPPHRCRC